MLTLVLGAQLHACTLDFDDFGELRRPDAAASDAATRDAAPHDAGSRDADAADASNAHDAALRDDADVEAGRVTEEGGTHDAALLDAGTDASALDSGSQIGCKNGDGNCPATCVHATDDDCPKVLGEACALDSDCGSGACSQQVCCDRSCDDACESCVLGGSMGTCTALSLDADPNNCGACGNVCPYGFCEDQQCKSTKWGFAAKGPSVETRAADTLMGMKLTLGQAGTLVALGMQTATAGVKLRLGLYADSGGAPNGLLAQTSELISAAGAATEGGVAPVELVAGDYWLFFIAEGNFDLSVENTNALWFYADRTYGVLPNPAPPLVGANLGFGDVYAVTTP